MNKLNSVSENKKGLLLTLAGMAVMILLVATKVVPSSQAASYSVLVGIACFFLVEGWSKTGGPESGLRFSTIIDDLKKPGVLFWSILPAVSGILTLILGNLLFQGGFSEHVMGRTDSLLSFDRTALLIVQVIVAALGEEIAFRGFFLGKGSEILPFWICALASSLCFAAGHIAPGSAGLVLFDVAGIFIDGLIFAWIYKKSGNCLISAFAHVLANGISIAIVLAFL